MPFVSDLINSTAGWSNGSTFKDLPNKIVSKIKKQKSSPNVFSFLFITSKLLKGIFFLKNTSSVANFCEYNIFVKFLFLRCL